jgi:dTDP-4-dehydrorhamnose 3,5-epimerase
VLVVNLRQARFRRTVCGKLAPFIVPIGFAHGFCTLESNTEVVYKVTNYYSRAHDFGVAWNDPDIGIEWPIPESEAILSDKDKVQPRIAEVGRVFD